MCKAATAAAAATASASTAPAVAVAPSALPGPDVLLPAAGAVHAAATSSTPDANCWLHCCCLQWAGAAAPKQREQQQKEHRARKETQTAGHLEGA
jgi:hypothetical protein